MIFSMTAFARQELKSNWGSAAWEIRSVNQRYLETFIRLPEQFRSLEPVIREKLRAKLQRGKIECYLRFEANEAASSEVLVNQALALQLIENAQWIIEQVQQGEINPFDVLRWPGVVAAQEQDLDSLGKELLNLFDQSLTDFIDSRAREGEKLKTLIEQRLFAIEEEINKVHQQLPEVMQWQRQRLLDRLEEAQIELDPQRLEQELVMLAQRTDVAEELDRLTAHISETRRILSKGGACGRRLDFMMQEFNREANTLGSKSINSQITQSAVELKVLIEQMREQIQNIE